MKLNKICRINIKKTIPIFFIYGLGIYASAIPLELKEIKEDWSAPTTGINIVTANSHGKEATITVGNINTLNYTKPFIGNSSKVYEVSGSYLNLDTTTTGYIKKGKAIINSGTMGDTSGAYILSLNGGKAEVSESETLINNGDIDGSEFGGAFGGRVSIIVSENSNSTVAHASTLKNKLTIKNSIDIHGATIAAGQSYANSLNQKSEITASSKENLLEIFGGEIDKNIMQIAGGYSYGFSGDANNYTGGGSEKVSTFAENNKIFIDNSSLKGNIFGGKADSTTFDGSASAKASNNKVTIKNINLSSITGGESSAMVNDFTDNKNFEIISIANQNIIELNDGNIKKITGAYAFSGDFMGNTMVSSIANGNKVIINNGKITGDSTNKSVEGGLALANSTSNTVMSEASYNEIHINSGEIENNIYAAISQAESSDAESKASANNNSIFINGGKVSNAKNIIAAGILSSSENNIESKNNKIEISGNPILDGTNLYGSILMQNAVTPLFKTHKNMENNSLSIKTKKISVNNIAAFQKIDFKIPNTIKNDEIILSLTSNDNTDLSNTTINASVDGNTNVNEIILLKKDNGTFIDNNINLGKLSEGISLLYDIEISEDKRKIFVNTKNPKISLNASTKSLVETPSGLASFINQGLHLTTEKVLDIATASSGSFITTNNTDIRNNTGSHIDIKGKHLNAGLSKKIYLKNANLVYGALIEYGQGKYKSYIENNIKAEGDIKNIGLGFFSKYTFLNNVSLENSLHIGRLNSDYKSSSFFTPVNYKYNTSYYAWHMGLGKVFKIDENKNIRLYSKYLMNIQNKKDVTLNTGEKYKFKSTTSSNILLGSNFSYNINNNNRIHTSLAYQYEFNGKAKATYKGLTTPTPSLKGSTFIVNLGWQAKLTNNITLDIELKKFLGKQRGIAFNLGANYKF
ncbi:MAG: autotransporter outer membrane beta-barrel domain-containing protein [Fusobacterium sp.]|uniref:autotransporter outer membrane beta-barrel domain-containing protein n=1 Tax=Fusobacterium sp. TaxID=68766 RepID=UPI0026DB0918|nr:autotransporter outer membrane beta-barrel domain-containing protein [Fusobacterium sp.]MDO4690023.1 autotransporter outer membrane beta-barrel domain-containing protein [Fusobacterium sp.]